MTPRLLNSLSLIVILVCAAIYVDLPNNRGLHVLGINRDFTIHEGLDLQGGIEILMEARNPEGPGAVSPDQLAAARSVVEKRVNAFGVAEPVIQTAGGNRIIVQLPGIADPDQAVRTIGQTGQLKFLDSGDTPLTVGQKAPDQPVVITGRDLKSADVGFGQDGLPLINFTLQPEATQKFGEYTTSHVGKYMSTTLDDVVLVSARIQSPITGGNGQITGRFSLEEARSIVIQLKYGALPVPLDIKATRTVGPTLGADSVRRSQIAGAIGLGIVAAFMLLYYRLPGLLADIALVLYGLFVLAIFKGGLLIIPFVTLTLSGIAGFILSIGMAVDANVLIFERLREELRSGKTLGAALEAGFARAWTSIRDSNANTIIICVILYFFGSNFGASIIQGFALTLGIGVVVSLFTAITVSRTLLRVAQSLFLRDAHSLADPRLRLLFGVGESERSTPAGTALRLEPRAGSEA